MESYANYAPPPKKNNTGLIIGLIIGGVVLCCLLPLGLVGGFGYFAYNKAKDMLACDIAFTNVWSAVEAYARDHHGKLPHSATWMDDVRPYYRKVLAEQAQSKQQLPFGTMSAEGTFSCSSEGVLTGMSFNRTLDAKPLDQIKNRMNTIVLFETDARGPNLSNKYEELPLASSPRMFGKPRGWFTVDADGQVRCGKARFTQGFNGAPNVVPDSEPPVQVTTETSNGEDGNDKSPKDKAGKK